MSAPGDLVRRRVEDALRALIEAARAAPCAAVRRARRTVAQPVAMTRTMVGLTVSGLLGRDAGVGDGGGSVPPRPARTTELSTDESGPPPRVFDDADDDFKTDPSLPIEGYDNLAASHIVARLDRLDVAELNEVKAYELATRGRRTVVGRIDQLLAVR